jgi:uncharacterized membrane protein
MNRIELKNRAKQSLTGNWGAAILGLVIYGAIVSLLSTTGVGSFVTGLVSLGYISLYLSILRGKTPTFEGSISAVTENIGTKFIATLLVSLYTFLWSLLFIIPGIVKSCSYAMATYIRTDNPELDWRESIDESRELMRGHKMELFMLDLSFIGWYFVGVLCFGVGALWVQAYHQTARANFYNELIGRNTSYVE